MSDREVDLVFDLFDKDESRSLEVGELHEYLEAAGRHDERRSSFNTPYHDGFDRRTSTRRRGGFVPRAMERGARTGASRREQPPF